jgi:hypothetical protein
MHRKDLNNKNKVYINNTKSYINTVETNLPYTLGFLILNQFLVFKNWKKLLQFVSVKRFSKLSYMFFYIFASFTPGKHPYFEIIYLSYWRKMVIQSFHHYFPCSHQVRHATVFLINGRANVLSLYKKDDETDKSNYRPISLLCVPGKLMETCVASTITTHLTEHANGHIRKDIQLSYS